MVMGEGRKQNFRHHHHHQRWDAMKESDEHEHEQQQQQQQHHHPCSSIEEASSTISNGSSSCDDDDDDDDTCSSSSSFDIVDDDDASCSSANSSRSSLYDLSDLMSHLPIKRGLSKFYHGKSDSFTSLARVKSIDDLPKKEKNNPKSTTFRSHTLPKPIISKKISRKKKYPSSKTHKQLHQ